MKKALIITPRNAIYAVDAPDKNLTDWIHGRIGNWFDCVRQDDFIGYVDDEGLLNGGEFNTIASIVFGRYLAGTVIAFGCLNENGEYDGETYDITEDAIMRFSWVAQAQRLHQENAPHSPYIATSNF